MQNINGIQIQVKKLLITVVCLALLCIPAVVAVVYYQAAQNTPVTESTITRMTIKMPDGTVTDFTPATVCDEPSIGENAIHFFMEMNGRSTPIAELPEIVDEKMAYTVTFTSRNQPYACTYYFTSDSEYAYYTDYNDKVFRIKETDAVSFLQSSYAYCMYSSSAIPSMAVGTEKVMPQSANWQYKSYDDVYRSAEVQVTELTYTYSVRGSLGLTFDIQPDLCSIVIKSGETTVYDGIYESIPANLFTENNEYAVSVSAKWYNDSARDYYGEENYTFRIRVLAPAVFYLGASSIDPGEFAVITGKNITDPQSVTLTCEPAINFTPVFFGDGSNVYALVPISMNIGLDNIASSYKFKLTCDGVTQEMVLNINPKKFLAQTYEITTTAITTYRSQKALTDFAAALKEPLTAQVAVRYFDDGVFGDPVSGRDIRTGFGLYRTLSGTGETYRHEGVDYVVYQNDTVIAAMDGQVTYIGNPTLSGRTVVIEHGYGLKTLYCHMNSVSVAVGETVKKGDTLGVVGTTGFTADTNLHFGTYVFDVPVSPYDIMDNGVLLADK